MIEYDEIIDNLSKIIEVTDNYAYKGVLIANKSAYIAADKVIAKVVFLKRDFTSVIGVPFKKGYEFSEDIYDEHLLKSIKYIDKRIMMYSDTLFYINKNKILNHIKQKYNSEAKQKKMELFIKIDDEIKLEFNPRKKSTSVSKSVYRVKDLERICPNFRISRSNIKVDTLIFYKVLNSSLFSECVRIDINSKFNFIKLSCLKNGCRINFMIKGN